MSLVRKVPFFRLCRMLIPKKNRKLIYETIFKEGVLVAKKDFNAPKHNEIESVPNLQVIKAMQVSCPTALHRLLTMLGGHQLEGMPRFHCVSLFQSLKSRGYVKEQFSWQHYYWYLTNEGEMTVQMRQCHAFIVVLPCQPFISSLSLHNASV